MAAHLEQTAREQAPDTALLLGPDPASLLDLMQRYVQLSPAGREHLDVVMPELLAQQQRMREQFFTD